ncbi:MAG: hypothetical protein FWG51_04845, partial [Firmicutes bacterium]|nr:hypothetical protein [Bacillota bacterium]
SKNTVMDNITLVGDNRLKASLNEYDNGNTTVLICVMGNLENGKKLQQKDGKIEGVRFTNSVFEKAFRLMRLSSCENPDNPIVVDNCVLRYCGEQGILTGDSVGGTLVTTYLNINNIIAYSIRMPAIGMTGMIGADCCGTKLTVTGRSNYFYTWTKMSQLDYGMFLSVNIASKIKDSLIVNEELYKKARYDNGDKIGTNIDYWINLVFYGSFNKNNIVDVSGSNLKGALTEGTGLEGQRVTINFVIPLTLSLWFFCNRENVTPAAKVYFPPDQIIGLSNINKIIKNLNID